MDRATARKINRAADYLLNRAAISWDALQDAYRRRTPDSRSWMHGTNPHDYWRRQWEDARGASPWAWLPPSARVALGATAAQGRFYAGDLDRAGYNGLLLDDSKDGTAVTGWSGGRHSQSNINPVSGLRGQGPGGGLPGATANRPGGGGGAATAGGDGGNTNRDYRGAGGPAVPTEFVLQAVLGNDYTRAKWLATGGGAYGNATVAGFNGGDSGGGIARIGLGDLSEGTSRTLQGTAGANGGNNSAAGGGGGGVYLGVCSGNYTLASGATINCAGGAGGTANNARNVGGAGSNGRMIVLAGGDITLTGTRTNVTVTEWRLLAGAFGAAFQVA